jgi:hypothetical protein
VIAAGSRNEDGFVRGLLVLIVIGVVFVGVAIAFRAGLGPLPDPDSCSAKVGGITYSIDPEQAENAAVIAAIGVRRGLPARAVSIALATAIQESKLLNVTHGDRDSLGLFQQRPSMGWGRPAQVLDPVYATNAFYDALIEVDGYQTMPITEAAQAVQRSAYPNAYADHEVEARTLASALTGYSPGAFTCTINSDPDLAEEEVGSSGLTDRASAVRRDLERAFGPQPLGGFSAEGVDDGHMNGSAHYEGRAIDVFFRPVNDENRRLGWAMAHYLVGRAALLHIDHVIFDDLIWTRGRSGWQEYDEPDSPGDPDILRHLDHVHVDVLAGS